MADAKILQLAGRRTQEEGCCTEVTLSPREDEVLIVGTREGLRVIANEILFIADHPESGPGSHLHVDPEEAGMIETSLGLAVGLQDSVFFELAPTATAEVWPARTIEPGSIRAIQITIEMGDCPVVLDELYRVLEVSPIETIDLPRLDFRVGDEFRYRTFTVVGDADQVFACILHLDDPRLNFFTHQQILKLAKSKP